MAKLREERVEISVSSAQKAAIVAKARKYGMSMTGLIISAVEAFVATHGKLGDEPVVAVSYGALTELSVYFCTTRDTLRELAARTQRVQDLFESARYEEALEVSEEILARISGASSDLKEISDTLKSIMERSMVKEFSLPFESAGWTVVIPDKKQQ